MSAGSNMEYDEILPTSNCELSSGNLEWDKPIDQLNPLFHSPTMYLLWWRNFSELFWTHLLSFDDAQQHTWVEISGDYILEWGFWILDIKIGDNCGNYWDGIGIYSKEVSPTNKLSNSLARSLQRKRLDGWVMSLTFIDLKPWDIGRFDWVDWVRSLCRQYRGKVLRLTPTIS